MKTRWRACVCAVLALLLVGAEKSLAGVSWSISVFDGPLGQRGYWVDRPQYGRCWYPAYVSSDWRPYCEGYWMWTDDGWYWVSDEPWAWATYHYGRWAYDSYYGWVWIPDTEWGPSWVCWREGGGYVGWAPLPPGATFGVGGDVVFRRPVQDRFFVFVEVNHFSEPIHRHALIVNKTTVINNTVNITKITRVNNVVVNHGPNFQNVQRVNSRRLTEPVPRAAASGSMQPRTFKTGTVGQPPRSVNGQQGSKHGPEVIHGATTAPAVAPNVTHDQDMEKKQPERPRVEPLPTESSPPPSEPTEHSRKQEGISSGKPAHDERDVERHGETRQGEPKGEKSKKGEQGGN